MSHLVDIRAVSLITPAPGALAEAGPLIAAQKPFTMRHPDFIGVDGMFQTGGYVQSCLYETDVIARLAHLLGRAYDDLIAAMPWDVSPDRRFTIYLALPDWLERIAMLRERFLMTVRAMDFARIAKAHYFFGYQPAGFDAFAAAAEAINAGQTEMAIVAGVDTLVAPAILDMRAYQGLARSPSNPHGAIPGEAAAMLLLQRESNGATAPIGRLRAVVRDTEPERLDDPQRGIMGRALAGCLVQAQDALGRGTVAGALIADANGERHRAEELGAVMARLAQGADALADPICPALSIGDIGVASAAVYASVVPYVVTQGAPHVLVATGANSGARAAGCFDQIR